MIFFSLAGTASAANSVRRCNASELLASRVSRAADRARGPELTADLHVHGPSMAADVYDRLKDQLAVQADLVDEYDRELTDLQGKPGAEARIATAGREFKRATLSLVDALSQTELAAYLNDWLWASRQESRSTRTSERDAATPGMSPNWQARSLDELIRIELTERHPEGSPLPRGSLLRAAWGSVIMDPYFVIEESLPYGEVPTHGVRHALDQMFAAAAWERFRVLFLTEDWHVFHDPGVAALYAKPESQALLALIKNDPERPENWYSGDLFSRE